MTIQDSTTIYRTNRARDFGFTLIEFIGVLSVIAILAAVIVPVIAKRMDRAARDAESTGLETLSDAFIQASFNRNDRKIPALVDLPLTIATYLNEPTNVVVSNKRKLNRVFMVHPGLNINGSGLPYDQDTSGSTNLPTNARLMMVSTIAKALPAINATNFDNIWSAPKGVVPTSLTNWGGRGDDLVIQRVELAPLFHKVVLMNVDGAPNIGRYSIDSDLTINMVQYKSRFAAYYMDGTVVNLRRPEGNTNVLDFQEVIRGDVSFVYQNNRWGRSLGVTQIDEGDFGNLVDRFLMQPVPCDPESGATQRSVITAFYDYLWGYADWAFGDPLRVPPVPPFSGANTSSSPQYPAYSVVLTAQGHLSGAQQSFTENLIK